MTTTTNEITFQEAQDEYFADIEDMIDEEIEAEVEADKAAVKAQAKCYERLNGLEVQCSVCQWRRADAVTQICEHCQDEGVR